MIKQRYTVQRGIIVNIVLMVLILMFAVISMNSGKMNLSPLEVLNVLLGNGTDKQNLIVFDFRLPRITLSILVGLGMGAAGVVMQSLLRNDMASPGTLGISSGSGLFVLFFVVFIIDRKGLLYSPATTGLCWRIVGGGIDLLNIVSPWARYFANRFDLNRGRTRKRV